MFVENLKVGVLVSLYVSIGKGEMLASGEWSWESFSPAVITNSV